MYCIFKIKSFFLFFFPSTTSAFARFNAIGSEVLPRLTMATTVDGPAKRDLWSVIRFFVHE